MYTYILELVVANSMRERKRKTPIFSPLKNGNGQFLLSTEWAKTSKNIWLNKIQSPTSEQSTALVFNRYINWICVCVGVVVFSKFVSFAMVNRVIGIYSELSTFTSTSSSNSLYEIGSPLTARSHPKQLSGSG